jgi:uncharacterized protein (TIGR03905 family)
MIYKTEGVCCNEIHLEVEDGVITELKFINGCDGNLQGIAKLAKGRKVDEIVNAVKGIQCKGRPTSCPDQLAKALLQFTN